MIDQSNICTGHDSPIGLSRRSFLNRFAGGLGGLAMADLLHAESGHTLHHAAKAKRVIYLFQSGGPSQIDLFDHKPRLNEETGKELPDSVRKGQRLTGMSGNQASLPLVGSPFKFSQHGQSGQWISELLPNTAKVADDMCIVNSMYTEAINHGPGVTFMQTGSQFPGRPSMGAWLTYGLGSSNENLPSFVVLKTKGDLILDRPLAEVGGKGLFVKELESAMLENRADLAVHSLKDVPALLPEGLELSVILKRENPHEVLVFRETHMTLEDLPPGSRIGTSSLRRGAQLKNMRPDLEVTSLRGNVPTRLKKLDSGEVDAAVLAAAGLIRLELEDRINQELSTEQMLPAIGQGVLALETRKGDDATLEKLRFMNDEPTEDCMTAERKVLETLEGNCQVPLAGFCKLDGNNLHLRALIAEPDGSTIFRAEERASRDESEELGTRVANQLLQQGGGALLQQLSAKEER